MSMKKYEEWNANHKHDNPPREKIVKLGRKITDVAGHIFGGVKVEDPEYSSCRYYTNGSTWRGRSRNACYSCRKSYFNGK